MSRVQIELDPVPSSAAAAGAEVQNTVYTPDTSRDSVARAGDLPAEVLTNIFGHLSESSSARNRIAITTVCRYWREVALGCASLWTRLPFLNPAFTELSFERARNLPLTIRLGQPARGAPSIWRHSICVSRVLCLSQRLKHISIVVDGSRDSQRPSLEDILSGCVGAAPLLESLYLECSAYDFEEGRHNIRDTFLRGGTPSLQSLGLINCAIQWANIPLASTLTHLQLSQGTYRRPWRGRRYQPSLRPSVADLLSSLRRCPSLVNLELRNYLPKSSDDRIPDPPLPSAITLTSLTRLSLDDEVQPISTFLHIVRIPKAVSVILEFAFDHGRNAVDFRNLLVALDRAWKDDRLDYRPLEGGPCQMDINGNEFEELPLTISLQFPECGTVRPTLVLSFGETSLDWFACLPVLAQQLSFDALVSLVVEDMYDYVLDTDVWKTTFAHCPRLQQIAFKYCSGQVGPFIDAFQCHATHTTSTSTPGACPHSLWLPALTDIQFEEAKFQKRDAGSPASFADFLRHRRTVTGKSINVGVKKCSNFHFYHYRYLLNIPDVEDVEVDWDGQEAVSDTDELSEDSEEEPAYSDEEDIL